MSTIDWSKAPPHATHWCPGNAKIEAGWIYNPGGTKGEFYSCYADRGLEHIPAFPDWRKSRLVQRPTKQSWTGEGMPPVGAHVEVRYAIEEFSVWHKAACVAVGQAPEGEQICVTRSEDGIIAVYRTDSHIRPARTPEQIAAEEREKARDEVLNSMAANMALEKNETLWQHRLLVVGEMLDMGYRKQVAP